MPAQEKQEVEQALRRLNELIEALETHADPHAGDSARELVALLLELHGLGLAKLMAILGAADNYGSIVARLVDNEHVRAMLLLHGLHPEDMETRVRAVVERLRPQLGVHRLRLEVVGTANGIVRLHLHGASAVTNGKLLWTLPSEIENAIFEAAPDAESVRIDGLELSSLNAASKAAE